MNPTSNKTCPRGFTLVELLTVIAIIAVLMALLFPAANAVKDAARKTQAKNDLTNIANAVKAYYTEYGKYPCGSHTGQDAQDYLTANDNDRKTLFDTLRVPFPSTPPSLNPRAIAFLEVPAAKNDVAGQRKGGVGSDGVFYDPWGSPYWVKMDNNYNGLLTNLYNQNTGAGFGSLNTGVIAWSCGKDQMGPTGGPKGTGSKVFSSSDDIISWQ
jgi:prepilin-type N-terminal cleavage/methylation domain-containing protein